VPNHFLEYLSIQNPMTWRRRPLPTLVLDLHQGYHDQNEGETREVKLSPCPKTVLKLSSLPTEPLSLSTGTRSALIPLSARKPVTELTRETRLYHLPSTSLFAETRWAQLPIFFLFSFYNLRDWNSAVFKLLFCRAFYSARWWITRRTSSWL